jgi:hypothetical protein
MWFVLGWLGIERLSFFIITLLYMSSVLKKKYIYIYLKNIYNTHFYYIELQQKKKQIITIKKNPPPLFTYEDDYSPLMMMMVDLKLIFVLEINKQIRVKLP